MKMSVLKNRLFILYLTLAIVMVAVAVSTVRISIGGDDIKGVVETPEFCRDNWGKTRGDILDRFRNPLVTSVETVDEDGDVTVERNYANVTPAYSKLIGYRLNLYGERKDEENPNKRRYESVRTEGLEKRFGEWLCLGNDPSLPRGGDIVLTIDSELENLCYDQIKDFKKSGAVVIDIETGEILAMTSTPGYDTKNLKDYENWEDFTEKMPDDSLINFSTWRQMPGSCMKIITGSVLYDAGFGDYVFDCSDHFEYDGNYIGDNGAAYGKLDLPGAIHHSSNVYFCNLVKTAGREVLEKGYTEQWHFGDTIELDITNVAPRICIDNRNLLYTSAIGLGKTEVSPLYICMATAAIGDRDGSLCTPYIVKEYIDAKGKVRTNKLSSRRVIEKHAVSKEARQAITEGMMAGAKGYGIAVVNGCPIAAKTGTATLDDKKTKVNIWMTAFAPADNPKYAVTIAAFEEKESGSFGMNLALKMKAIMSQLLTAEEAE